MKNEKMSLEKMKGVLSHVLSREEMKEVMAGSDPGHNCGTCVRPIFGPNYTVYPCYFTGSSCKCGADNGVC